jgi:hypothetical protein
MIAVPGNVVVTSPWLPLEGAGCGHIFVHRLKVVATELKRNPCQ